MRKQYNEVSLVIDKKLEKNDDFDYLLNLNDKLQGKIKKTEAFVNTLEHQVNELDKLNNQLVRSCYTGTVQNNEPRPIIQ